MCILLEAQKTRLSGLIKGVMVIRVYGIAGID